MYHRLCVCHQILLMVVLAMLICFAPASLAVITSSSAGRPSLMDAELREFQFDALRQHLRSSPSGEEQDYFAGMMANRLNQISESIALLRQALPGLRQSSPARAALALQALANDYSKSFQYAEADRAYTELLTHFAAQLGTQQLESTRDDAAVLHILRNAPAQTITWNGSLQLQTQRNPLGSENADLTVNGVRGSWLLDTGANYSVVSSSYARQLGLKPLAGIAQTQAGITGIENPLHVAIIPSLQAGSATLHNVVVMIIDDASLKINLGKWKYQINAILGYPAFQSMGRITFFRDGRFAAGGGRVPSAVGAQIYLKELTPVLECTVAGRRLPFSFDTGATTTDLLVRYYQRFYTSHGATWKKAESKSAGVGGIVTRIVYLQPEMQLRIGDATVLLKQVSIIPESTNSDTDDLYGNLGQDVVAGYDSYTLDFRTMRFKLGKPLAEAK